MDAFFNTPSPQNLELKLNDIDIIYPLSRLTAIQF